MFGWVARNHFTDIFFFPFHGKETAPHPIYLLGMGLPGINWGNRSRLPSYFRAVTVVHNNTFYCALQLYLVEPVRGILDLDRTA